MFTIRGATTIAKDSAAEIQKAVEELLTAILDENKLQKKDIQTILCASTMDIQSAYPAKFVRQFGFAHATLFSMIEPNIKDALPYCIRLLLFINRTIGASGQLQNILHNLQIADFMQNYGKVEEYCKQILELATNLQGDIRAEENQNSQTIKHIYLRGAKFLRTDLNKINIAIDGPAGSGKSTLAKMLAEQIGIYYLDTGAMYRATTYYLCKKGIDIYDCYAVQKAIQKLPLQIEYKDKKQYIYVAGEDVSDKIRTPQIALATAVVAQNRTVREKLITMQQKVAAQYSCVVDGRDIGYNVLPHAKFKFFLVADAEIRAKRRQLELESKGEKVEYNKLLKEIIERDRQDEEREIAPLKRATDAVLIDTTSLTLQEVLQRVMQIIMDSH